MKEKIREAIEIVKELEKLVDQLIKLVWKVSSLIGIILFILYSTQ